MSKKLKNLSYVERLKMFISRMQTSNWIDDGDTPTPSTLIPIHTGQSISGVTVNCFDTDDLSNFVSAFNVDEEYGWSQVVEINNSDMIMVAKRMGGSDTSINSKYPFLMIYIGSADVYLVYAPQDIDIYFTPEFSLKTSRGWYNMDPEAVVLTPISGLQEIKLDSVSSVKRVEDSVASINGIYFGAVEAGPTPPTPGGLTQLENGDSISSIVIDCDNVDTLKSYLASVKIDSEGEYGDDYGEALIEFSGIYATLSLFGGFPGSEPFGFNAIIFVTSDSSMIIGVPQDVAFMGATLTEGWNQVTLGDAPVINKLEGKNTINLVETNTIQLNPKIDTINGVVFGKE